MATRSRNCLLPLLCALLLSLLVACTTPAGRSTGQVVDDAAITTQVKADLLADKEVALLETFAPRKALVDAPPVPRFAVFVRQANGVAQEGGGEPEQYWPYRQTIAMIRNLMGERMFPLTLDGLARGMRLLSK